MRDRLAAEIAAYLRKLPDVSWMPVRVEMQIVFPNATETHVIEIKEKKE